MSLANIFVAWLQLEHKDKEIRDLHERNSHLMIQVDQLTEKASNSSGHSITLFNELSQFSGNQDIAMATDSPINPVSNLSGKIIISIREYTNLYKMENYSQRLTFTHIRELFLWLIFDKTVTFSPVHLICKNFIRAVKMKSEVNFFSNFSSVRTLSSPSAMALLCFMF